MALKSDHLCTVPTRYNALFYETDYTKMAPSFKSFVEFYLSHGISCLNLKQKLKFIDSHVKLECEKLKTNNWVSAMVELSEYCIWFWINQYDYKARHSIYKPFVPRAIDYTFCKLVDGPGSLDRTRIKLNKDWERQAKQPIGYPLIEAMIKPIVWGLMALQVDAEKENEFVVPDMPSYENLPALQTRFNRWAQT